MAQDFLVVGAAEIATADEENVQQPVAVVVEKGDTAPERFEERAEIGFLAVVRPELDARFRRDVPENRPGQVDRLGRIGGSSGVISRMGGVGVL